MGILLWIIFGALAGWIASIFAGTNHSQGVIGNIVAGILGAIVGGWIMSLFGKTGVTGFNLPSLLVAIVGAFVVLVIFRILFFKR